MSPAAPARSVTGRSLRGGTNGGAVSAGSGPASLRSPVLVLGEKPPVGPQGLARGWVGGRLRTRVSVAERGRRSAPGALTRGGGARRLRRARGRSRPGPGAVAARLPALASRGPRRLRPRKDGPTPAREPAPPRGRPNSGGGRGRARASPPRPAPRRPPGSACAAVGSRRAPAASPRSLQESVRSGGP